MEGLIQLAVFAVLIIVGFSMGGARERRHKQELTRREQALAHMLLTDLKSFPGGADPARGAAVMLGEAVIATDYMKTFLSGLRNIFGGEMRSYEMLMSRARREAVTRMMERAHGLGYDAVCNLRLDTVAIGAGTKRGGAPMVEIMATGTAYKRLSAA